MGCRGHNPTCVGVGSSPAAEASLLLADMLDSRGQTNYNSGKAQREKEGTAADGEDNIQKGSINVQWARTEGMESGRRKHHASKTFSSHDAGEAAKPKALPSVYRAALRPPTPGCGLHSLSALPVRLLLLHHVNCLEENGCIAPPPRDGRLQHACSPFLAIFSFGSDRPHGLRQPRPEISPRSLAAPILRLRVSCCRLSSQLLSFLLHVCLSFHFLSLAFRWPVV